jgi:ABC-2 type transport system ATP-binding protein
MKYNNTDHNNQKTIITVHNISKKFMIPREKSTTLKGAFISALRYKKAYEVFHALEDVCFSVIKGECFGIVGKNGSGKSTLLKILSGVYVADSGLIKMNGGISPFLELGIGFNPELSGRDNLYLNATVLGMSKKEINEKFDTIVAFSEIGRFIDQKLKNYSSGMQVRLAFSIAIHTNRETLIFDEIFAVGDAGFQQKSLAEFNRLRREGKTIILVSHDSEIIRNYCDRALLLKDGNVHTLGHPEEVLKEYERITQNN